MFALVRGWRSIEWRGRGIAISSVADLAIFLCLISRTVEADKFLMSNYFFSFFGNLLSDWAPEVSGGLRSTSKLGDIVRSLSFILISVFSVPLFLTSGITCGCEPNPDTLAGQMRIFEYPGSAISDAAENQTAAIRSFLGRDIHALPLNKTPLDKECSFLGDRNLYCEYWNELGILHGSGRFVAIHADSANIVDSVTVVPISQWFGIALNRPKYTFQPMPSAHLN